MSEWRKRITAQQMPEAHRKFSDVLGVEAALKLFDNFGGEEIYIPKTDAIYNVVRDAEIRRRRAEGYSVRQLCGLYGLERQTIYDILKKDDRRR